MSGPGGERAEAGEPVAGLPQDPAARPNTGEEPEAAPVTAPRPVHDGQAFRLRGDPPSVMRLSRQALASVGAVACLSIGEIGRASCRERVCHYVSISGVAVY